MGLRVPQTVETFFDNCYSLQYSIFWKCLAGRRAKMLSKMTSKSICRIYSSNTSWLKSIPLQSFYNWLRKLIFLFRTFCLTCCWFLGNVHSFHLYVKKNFWHVLEISERGHLRFKTLPVPFVLSLELLILLLKPERFLLRIERRMCFKFALYFLFYHKSR